ncbi:hypothetical protein RJT13_03885 [Segatella copri]|uniref:hypothetical protein n=1 Tax=Segatella copri TaxID=165179 RepID=UPI002916C11B|nr:hypothetical protein [Segatella copri]MDV3120802.1 hypothetical protein [Segatella copri]
MKKLLFFLMMLTINIVSFAQNSEPEKASPMTDTEIVRKCIILDVEGKLYDNVTVTIKSNQPDFFFTDKYKVKVTVTDASGSKVWNKTFKNAFLYVFPNGQVQVGKPNFHQMIISRADSSSEWIGMVREKEGVY